MILILAMLKVEKQQIDDLLTSWHGNYHLAIVLSYGLVVMVLRQSITDPSPVWNGLRFGREKN